MAEHEHTPGPWEVTDIPQPVRKSGLCIKTAYGHPSMDDSELVPAVVTHGINAKANAHLIAAAPDLLSLCEQIAGFELSAFDCRADQSRAYAKLKRAARAAIAKARGIS